MIWKCSNCGYNIDGPAPPEQCPSCNEKCHFVDVSCYIPDCGGSGGGTQDERLTRVPEDTRVKP